MVKLQPNRKKLPAGRMILYVLIVLALILALILWKRIAGMYGL